MGGGGHADAASSRDVLKLVGGVLLTATLVMLIWVRSTPTFVDWTDDEGEFSVVYDAMRGDRISVDARSDDMAMDLEILIGDVIVRTLDADVGQRAVVDIEVEDAGRIEVTVRGTGHGDVDVDLDRRFPLALIPLIVGGILLLLGFSPDRDGAKESSDDDEQVLEALILDDEDGPT